MYKEGSLLEETEEEEEGQNGKIKKK